MTKRRLQNGFTLVEVLTSAIVIGIGLAAAVSMSSTVMLQEELAWRASVALNQQENAARLWQLGFDRNEINSLLPANPVVSEVLVTSSAGTVTTPVSPTSVTDPLAGDLEKGVTSATVRNFSNASTQGSTTAVEMYRPTIR